MKETINPKVTNHNPGFLRDHEIERMERNRKIWAARKARWEAWRAEQAQKKP